MKGNNQPSTVDAQHTALVLASQSPRRQQLLTQLGFNPIIYPVDIDETPLSDELPLALVQRLALSKARQCKESVATQRSFISDHYNDIVASVNVKDCVVIGADTVVDLDGQVIGKPANRHDCLQTLQKLSGQTHMVHSGVCVLSPDSPIALVEVVTSAVSFCSISAARAAAYWDTGEPADKAGGYAIQGIGAVFVENLQGSYSNVMGLPLYETAVLLARAGLPALER